MSREFQELLTKELENGKSIELRRNNESTSSTLSLEIKLDPKSDVDEFICEFVVQEYGIEIFRTPYLWKAVREFEKSLKG